MKIAKDLADQGGAFPKETYLKLTSLQEKVFDFLKFEYDEEKVRLKYPEGLSGLSYDGSTNLWIEN